jgi:16S rRNA (uracil1498-N3)-methyltransferase
MRINSYTPPGTLSTDIVVLSPEESHHLAKVLRVEAGQELTLFDGQGTRAEGVVDTVTKKEVTVRITARATVPPPAVEITLVQAVCKPDRFELILQKATELGVRRIQPVVSAHTVNRSKEPEKQMERWQTIVRNAAQQCGTAWLPELLPLETFASFFPMSGKTESCRAAAAAGRSVTIPALQKIDVCFIGSLHPNAKPFREAFRSLDKSKIKTATMLIGPEGDFTEEEVNAAVAAGASPVTFGSQILRTETAAIFGLSVLAYELL